MKGRAGIRTKDENEHAALCRSQARDESTPEHGEQGEVWTTDVLSTLKRLKHIAEASVQRTYNLGFYNDW